MIRTLGGDAFFVIATGVCTGVGDVLMTTGVGLTDGFTAGKLTLLSIVEIEVD